MRYGFLHATFRYADKQNIEGIRSHSGFRIPLFRVRPSAILSVCHFGIPSLLFYVVNDTEYLSPSAFLHKGKSLFLMHNASYKRGSFAPIILTFLPSFYPRRCLGLTYCARFAFRSAIRSAQRTSFQRLPFNHQEVRFAARKVADLSTNKRHLFPASLPKEMAKYKLS